MNNEKQIQPTSNHELGIDDTEQVSEGTRDELAGVALKGLDTEQTASVKSTEQELSITTNPDVPATSRYTLDVPERIGASQ